MVIGVVSAKGSPGATTTALALTAAAEGRGLMVELDPSGGSIECWTGVTGEPGLVRAASALRRISDPEVVAGCAVEAPRGISTLLAPTDGTMAESTIRVAVPGLMAACAALDRDVVVDGGRWAASQSTAGRVAGLPVVAVVCTPTVAGVEAARALVAPLRAAAAGGQVVLVLVGDRPYSAGEVASVVGVPVAGVVPWDRRAVGLLAASGRVRAWSRTALARSARSTLEALQALSVSGAVRA